MSCLRLHKNDIGTAFTVEITTDGVVANIADATEKSLLFYKPDGTTSTQTASFVTDGTDGQIRYITTSGFLDVIGKWSIQAHITTPSGAWYTDIDTFKVERNLV